MKTGFWETLKPLICWIASLVEDKRGSVSSKRVGFFIAFWLLKVLITTPGANPELIWPIIVLIAGLAGLTLPEWFSTLKSKNNE